MTSAARRDAYVCGCLALANALGGFAFAGAGSGGGNEYSIGYRYSRLNCALVQAMQCTSYLKYLRWSQLFLKKLSHALRANIAKLHLARVNSSLDAFTFGMRCSALANSGGGGGGGNPAGGVGGSGIVVVKCYNC